MRGRALRFGQLHDLTEHLRRLDRRDFINDELAEIPHLPLEIPRPWFAAFHSDLAKGCKGVDKMRQVGEEKTAVLTLILGGFEEVVPSFACL